ncbi:hypothetical protein ASPZODRAFT_170350 [Penicilliopsis zonata CBS 506.65]|uniref:Alpha/beta hydrolase fold-3 domain-containing protein n=1 Tax=Penicilliopsis zonata CBS 506.65 TaxID=1073090 RepID=A0A1L9S4R4_9EURO|nr:hypothetical protein ASPZODRAFT_170350 [Penicilliopsis zonata CBS 506.65]OJJ42158.1 hypothetical protein ASPZODRAFT_170350 [Penicilliopsis zonata CBS 506.65]
MKSVILQHFAPCSKETEQQRVQESEEYERKKTKKVHFWDCRDAQEYRQLEKEGKGVFDMPVYDPDAQVIDIQSTPRPDDPVHDIPVRILRPKGAPRGILMFIHGGGFVIGSSSLHDNVLRLLAEQTDLIVASVEYRLAPEYKLPAGSYDCVDAAMYLLSPDCEKTLGSTLSFICGESAGGYLTVQTALMLRDAGIDVRKRLAGIMPVYPIVDLSFLPSVRAGTASGQGVPMPTDDADRNFIALSLPREVWTSKDKIKNPIYSPLYANLGDMPPAMITVGAIDSLLDDSILLAARWELAGNQAELKIYPGSPHGYLVVDLDVTKEAIADLVDFMKGRLNSS